MGILPDSAQRREKYERWNMNPATVAQNDGNAGHLRFDFAM
jgi:hypothetical protein